MSEEQVGVRRRRSRAETEQLAAEYATSGLSRQEFCRQHGLALSTLQRYRKRGQAPAVGNRWLTVELSGANQARGSEAGSGLALVLSRGRRIEVGRGFDPETLSRLVKLLERC